VPTFYMQLGIIDPSRHAAWWPQFGREHLIYLSVCFAPTVEERDELLWDVTTVHVEGEKTAVLATYVTDQALQLSVLTVPFRAVVTYERLDKRHEWYNAISFVVCARIVGCRSYGWPV